MRSTTARVPAVFRPSAPVPGTYYTGTGARVDEQVGQPGAIRTLDSATGDIRWNYPIHDGSASAGLMATAGGLIFAAGADGNPIAPEDAMSKLLWHYQTGERTIGSPVPYAEDGIQYISITSGSALLSFGF
jgi:outer membrane protein assembly factor BamB